MGFTGVATSMKGILTMAVVAIALVRPAYAHEGEHHGRHADHETMANLHKMMPMYEEARGKLDTALAKGDAATVTSETAAILKTIPDLKRSKPHKNLKEIAAFRKIATSFGRDVKKTAELAKAGDFAKAREAFLSAEKRCDECHAKFRD